MGALKIKPLVSPSNIIGSPLGRRKRIQREERAEKILDTSSKALKRPEPRQEKFAEKKLNLEQ
jgi:hypothetical protein